MRPSITQLVLTTTILVSGSVTLPSQCYALNFDGRGDRVTVPYSSSFPVAVFTASAWIKTGKPARRASIISFGEDNKSGNGSWTLYVQTTGAFEVMLEDIKDNNGNYSSGINVGDNKWHHVAATRSSSGRIDMYVDGTLVKTFSSSLKPSSNNKQWINIGCTMGKFGPPPPPPQPAWFFSGMIDEPAMWNVALSAAQIASVHSKGVDPKTTGLVGSWSFNEGTGQTVKDASSAKNDGYLGASTSVDSADPAFVKLSGSGTYTTFGTGCKGSNGTPALAPSTGQLPHIGQTFEVAMTNLPTNGTAMGVIGFSKSAWGSFQLPLNLSYIGMTSCVLHVEAFVMVPVAYTGSTAKWTVSIPDWPILLGRKFYQQGFVPDAGANPFRATLTNAGEGVVGCK